MKIDKEGASWNQTRYLIGPMRTQSHSTLTWSECGVRDREEIMHRMISVNAASGPT